MSYAPTPEERQATVEFYTAFAQISQATSKVRSLGLTVPLFLDDNDPTQATLRTTGVTKGFPVYPIAIP